MTRPATSFDKQANMRSAVRNLQDRPESPGLQSKGNEASVEYKQRNTTLADFSAVGHQAIETGAGSAASFGARAAFNAGLDVATQTQYPNSNPAAKAAIMSVPKHILSTVAAALGTQLNHTTIKPNLNQHIASRVLPTPISFIYPDKHVEDLDAILDKYGSNERDAALQQQNTATKPNLRVASAAYATAAAAATMAGYATDNIPAKIMIGLAGPATAGLALGGATAYGKLTATVNAPSEQGIKELKDLKEGGSEVTIDQLQNMSRQKHNLFYTAEPSFKDRTDAKAFLANQRPETVSKIAESAKNRFVGLEPDLRVLNLIQAGAAATGAALLGNNPLGAAGLRAAAGAVGILDAVATRKVLGTVGDLNANDKIIAERGRPLVQGTDNIESIDLAEQGGVEVEGEGEYETAQPQTSFYNIDPANEFAPQTTSDSYLLGQGEDEGESEGDGGL